MSHLIRDYLDELHETFGAAAPIDGRVLKSLYERQDYGAMLGWIKLSMRLDCPVGLRIVEGPDENPPLWIEMPIPTPIYGSPAFRSTRFIVNARRAALNRSFPYAVAGFAHELSHIALSATQHRLRDDEKAVDLTAMLLGYQTFVGSAEVTRSQGAVWSFLLMLALAPFGILFWRSPPRRTWRLGYLTRDEAATALEHLAARGRGAMSS
jgi:hypothetical protein